MMALWTVEVVRWLAVHDGSPVGWLATAWLSRSAAAPLSTHRSATTALDALLDVMVKGRAPAARKRALATVERLWAESSEHRARIWYAIWIRLNRNGRSPYRNEMLPVFARFLLGPDPDSPHLPRVRLVAGMSLDSPALFGQEQGVPSLILSLARFADDPPVRDAFAGVLSATDEPHLLAVLEAAFVEGMRDHASYSRDISMYRLWAKDDDTPTPLLEMLLANPHLPRSAGDGSALELAVLMALRRRFELLAGFDGRDLVFRLVKILDRAPPAPAPAVAACRRALRSFEPGPAREAVCWCAPLDALDDEAKAAAIEAGYLPADPDLVPLFLVLTRQWDRFAQVDPGGRVLYHYGMSTGFDDERFMLDPVKELLYMLEEGGVPAAVRRVCRETLRDLDPGYSRDRVCDLAVNGYWMARQIAVRAGFLPSEPDRLPVFLFMTGQWDRYDAADPDGRLLRAYAAELPSWDSERDRLCEVAGRAGRPMPCDPVEHDTPTWHRPGGTGVAGTGGFSTH